MEDEANYINEPAYQAGLYVAQSMATAFDKLWAEMDEEDRVAAGVKRRAKYQELKAERLAKHG